jgi:hypothetical protein
MSPEQQIQQAQRRIHYADAMMCEAAQLDDIAAQLMVVQRYWNAPNRQANLAAALAESRAVWHGIQNALAEGRLVLPLEVQHNLLILSVYADSKMSACEADPGTDMLGSLREWRVAA